MIYKKEITLTPHYDIAILGGGPAGIFAAISAARNGAKPILIERFGFLGGMATAGYVNPISEFACKDERVVGGIPWEFIEKMVAFGGAIVEDHIYNVSFDPEAYKLIAQRMVLDAGVELMMNTSLVDCIMEDKKIKSVIVTNKSGLHSVSADYFIDATGDADLAYFAGAEFLPKTRDMQPGSLCFCISGVDTSTERMHFIHHNCPGASHQIDFVREFLLEQREKGVDIPLFGGPWFCTTVNDGCITVNMTRSHMNAVDSEDYQRAECSMREDVFTLFKLMKDNFPEFKNAYISSVAPMAGIRETRRIRGLHVLTGKEYIENVKFEDSIARACHPVDIHLPGNEGQSLTFPEKAGYIPYRSLINATHPNLIVAGRAVSADEDAFAAIRVQAPCMETGQAAGVAAVMCMDKGIAVQELDSKLLTQKVREMGAFV